MQVFTLGVDSAFLIGEEYRAFVDRELSNFPIEERLQPRAPGGRATLGSGILVDPSAFTIRPIFGSLTTIDQISMSFFPKRHDLQADLDGLGLEQRRRDGRFGPAQRNVCHLRGETPPVELGVTHCHDAAGGPLDLHNDPLPDFFVEPIAPQNQDGRDRQNQQDRRQ